MKAMIFRFPRQKNQTREHLTLGAQGENEAVKYLKNNRYKIIGRNVHVGKSEIDIIARKGNFLVFVEVKTRTVNKDVPAYSRPADAVNKSKAAYLIRGANGYIRDNFTKYSRFYKRFDIIEVYVTNNDDNTASYEIKHFENAVN